MPEMWHIGYTGCLTPDHTEQTRWQAQAVARQGAFVNHLFVAELDTAVGAVKVGAMICFDREFPETARLLMLKEAEIVLVPNACLLDDIRLAQFRTRAVENAMVMAMANYPDPTCGGRSVAYMADGTQLALADQTEQVLMVDVALSKVHSIRRTGLWGNAFRRPHRYTALSEPRSVAVFARTNAFGEPFDPAGR